MTGEMENLLEVTDEEKSAIFKKYNVTEGEFEDMVEIVNLWLKKTQLPQEDTIKVKIKTAMLNCKLDIERTKRCIEGYYRLRTIYSEFFDRLVPNTDDYSLAKTLSKTTIMPKLTPDLCRISIFRIDNPQMSAPDGSIYQILSIMGVEFRLFTGDYFYSNILIIDLKDIGLKNVVKYTPNVCNLLISCLITLNLRLKNIHFVNLPTVFDKIIGIVKFFIPSRFYKKICIHQNHESLYKYIPKDYLPLNYGGTQLSIEQIQDKWCNALEKREEVFRKLLKAKCDDIMEKKVPENENFGLEGSFRKLTLD